ncbi:MAG: response regulator, partial [Anaerolineae bacterium]|nr:response regulator [Anaerolineae bacterium]
KILVIDDDQVNINLITRYLTMIGYEVVSATNGADGLDLFQKHHPDLILLDVIMPGMNGFRVCQIIRDEFSVHHIPIVMVTSLQETEQRIAALESGADDFLSKPFSIYELAARVKSLLRIKHQHDELEQRNHLLHHVMTRYMAPEVSAQILNDPERYLRLGGESRQISVLFADIRGFTSYAQTHGPTRVVELLNLIFNELTQVVLKWRGTLDKYMGDAMMAVYGTPVDQPDHALRAVRTALDMHAAFTRLQADWSDRDERRLGLGIGINTGEAVVGNIGTENLMNYTAIGDMVNIAQRLEEIATSGHTLISGATLQHISVPVYTQDEGKHVLRGRQEETQIYDLLDLGQGQSADAQDAV